MISSAKMEKCALCYLRAKKIKMENIGAPVVKK